MITYKPLQEENWGEKTHLKKKKKENKLMN